MLSGNIATSSVVMKKLSAFSLQQKPLFIAGAFNSAPRITISNVKYYQKNPGGERGGGILASQPDGFAAIFLEP